MSLSPRVTGRHVVLALWVCVYLAFTPVNLPAQPRTAAAPAGRVTDADIDRAMHRLRGYLLSQQDPATGGWLGAYTPTFVGDTQSYQGGLTALVVYALLIAGEPAQSPPIAKALEYLGQADGAAEGRPKEVGGGAYVHALRAQAWAQLPDTFMPQLDGDARRLLAAQRNGLFGFHHARPDSMDHNATLYGALGLDAWQARGGNVPPSVWRGVMDHFLRVQNDDGGWSYQPGPGQASTASMTCAGLTVLALAQRQLDRGLDEPQPATQAALYRGLQYLARQYDQAFKTESGNGYLLYDMERVGLAYGLRHLGERDWFAELSRFIVQRTGPRGAHGDVVDSAFYLAFLARGRVPVWASKLQAASTPTDRRPNALHFLTKGLSSQTERELNWQRIDLKLDPAIWRSAPVAFLAANQALALTPHEKANLKLYLDTGGLLVTLPEKSSPAFMNSVRALAQELYPQSAWGRLPTDHPIYSCVHPVRAPAAQPVEGLSNGARDLILMPLQDWGMAWQRDAPDFDQDLWRLAINLYVHYTEAGHLESRLAHYLEPPAATTDTSPTRRVPVVRVRYAAATPATVPDGGNWLPEPMTWRVFQLRHAERISRALTIRDADLAALGSEDAPLAHLTGVDTHDLSGPERDAIQRYVARGGTLLIETVGGRGAFAADLTTQITEMYGQPFVRLPSDHPLISGRGLPNGMDLRTIRYRPSAVLAGLSGRTPLLNVLMIDDRPAIIVSPYDLSLGVLDVKRLGVLGYAPEDAQPLLCNLIQLVTP